MTPLWAEVPLEKPWLWRLTAMMSSSKLMHSIHSVKSLYLSWHTKPVLVILFVINLTERKSLITKEGSVQDSTFNPAAFHAADKLASRC